MHPDQINPGSDYERAVTIENAIRLLITPVPANMWQWAMSRAINSYGLRLVHDMGLANYEQQMRTVTAMIDQCRSNLMVVPSYQVTPITPSNLTSAGNP